MTVDEFEFGKICKHGGCAYLVPQRLEYRKSPRKGIARFGDRRSREGEASLLKQAIGDTPIVPTLAQHRKRTHTDRLCLVDAAHL